MEFSLARCGLWRYLEHWKTCRIVPWYIQGVFVEGCVYLYCDTRISSVKILHFWGVFLVPTLCNFELVLFSELLWTSPLPSEPLFSDPLWKEPLRTSLKLPKNLPSCSSRTVNSNIRWESEKLSLGYHLKVKNRHLVSMYKILNRLWSFVRIATGFF